MKSSLIDTRSADWESILAGSRYDFYHLPAYVELSARQDGGDPCALMVQDGERAMLLPLILRPIEDGIRDATSPYGYPGPIASRDAPPAFVTEALRAGIDQLAQEGIVSLFIRLHPLLNPAPPEGVGTVVKIGDTVSVDLRLPADERWTQTRRNHRQQIRQALETGFEVRVDDGREALETFKVLYRATMTSVGAEAYYFFDDVYFDGLKAALGDRLHIAIASLDDRAGAAGMFVATDGIVQMHLTGHDESLNRHQPMKLVFHHVRQWCQERGADVLHLGGGRGGAADSLLHFKAGFSPDLQAFDSLRVVILPDVYDDLVLRRGVLVDPAGPSVFPLYRQG
jgi:hypothetical protein